MTLYLERKFYIPEDKVTELRAFLETSFPDSDPYPDSWVDTLYWDAADNRYLEECRDGVFFKTKLRLRRYADSGPWPQFQLKRKFGERVEKYKFTWDKEIPSTLSQMLTGNPHPQIALEILRRPHFPRVFVGYRRCRYACGPLRITLDHRLSFSSYATGLRRAMRGAVLELKGEGEFPLEFLPQATPLSFSKYLLGADLLESNYDRVPKYR